MSHLLRKTVLSITVIVFCVGCKKAPPPNKIPEYMAALNGYFAAHPNCLWQAPTALPVTVPVADTTTNAQMAALVSQGLLLRSVQEKARLDTDQAANVYDLTPQGRAAWSADDYQPGTGNFCYGNRSVDWIGLNSPNNGKVGATSDVIYGYSLKGQPAWAKSAQIQTAFPQLQTDIVSNKHVGHALLVNTESGWQVQSLLTDVKPAP